MAEKFKLPPLSPLIGGTPSIFEKVISGKKIAESYRQRVFYTKLLIRMLTPLRAYEHYLDRNLQSKKLHDPVFILGHWRSGTTHLHNLMCKDPAASFVTTYHTVFTNFLHSQGLLKPFMRMIMPGKRPSDNVRLDPDFPQEEEFAISNMTNEAFYHFFYFPSTTDELYRRSVEMEVSDAKSEWTRIYHKLLLKAQLNTGNGRLVVKNPVNTGRLKTLYECYPDAKFINIHRNPFIVFLSTKKFFKELFPTLWFESMDEDELNDMILELYVRLNGAYIRDAAAVDPSKLMEVKFGDFEEDPISYLETIYQVLDIEGYDSARQSFETYLRSLGAYKKNSYTISKKLVDKIESRWSSIYKRWNYDFPDNLIVTSK